MPRTKYDAAKHPVLAAALAAAGKIDNEIAPLLGITRKTIHVWRKTHPEFDEAMTDGKEPADEKVVNSLFKRATGYEFEEVEVTGVPTKGKNGDTRIENPRMRKTKRQLAPDTTACIFWLKNRRPDLWRDVQERKHEVAVGSFAALAKAVCGGESESE